MKVLLSIKPEYVEKIFSGEKRFEYRKSIFKRKKISTIVIYSTMPVGKIVGEFTVRKIHKDSPSAIWNKTQNFSGISYDYYKSYFTGKKCSYAIEIKTVTKYAIPKDPKKLFPHFMAPQSFCYLKQTWNTNDNKNIS